MFLGILFFIIWLIECKPIITDIVLCTSIIAADVPEGLLATVTVSLTHSAQRMLRKQVSLQKLEDVKMFGSTTCIWSDKTGSFTQNCMTIVHVEYHFTLHIPKTAATEATFDTKEPWFKELFFIASVCGKAVFYAKEIEYNPETSINDCKVNGDVFEAGIFRFQKNCLLSWT